MGGRNLALTNIVEQSFCFVGKGIKFGVADNATVALHVMEKAEDIVDQFIAANGIFFQIQQGIGKIFDGIVGFINKIFQVAFAKGRERVCRNFGQGEHPFLARYGRASRILY